MFKVHYQEWKKDLPYLIEDNVQEHACVSFHGNTKQMDTLFIEYLQLYMVLSLKIL